MTTATCCRTCLGVVGSDLCWPLPRYAPHRKRVRDTLLDWRRQWREWHELSALDDLLLRDIGLKRADVTRLRPPRWPWGRRMKAVGVGRQAGILTILRDGEPTEQAAFAWRLPHVPGEPQVARGPLAFAAKRSSADHLWRPGAQPSLCS